MHFGEAAAEVDAGGSRGKGRVDERVEFDHVASGGTQDFFGFGVSEGERAPARHRDDGPGSGRGLDFLSWVPRRSMQRHGIMGEAEHGVEVDVRGDDVGNARQSVSRLGAFGGRYQTEMT